MRRPIMLLAMLPLLIAAASPTSDPMADAKNSPARDDLLLCKTFPPLTGTRLGERRICLTNAEWRMLDQISWAGYFPGTDHLLYNAAPLTGGGTGR